MPQISLLGTERLTAWLCLVLMPYNWEVVVLHIAAEGAARAVAANSFGEIGTLCRGRRSIVVGRFCLKVLFTRSEEDRVASLLGAGGGCCCWLHPPGNAFELVKLPNDIKSSSPAGGTLCAVQ